MRSTLAALLVLALVAALVLPGLAGTEEASRRPIAIGDTVPTFQLKDLAGATFDLSKARTISEADALAAIQAAVKARAESAAVETTTQLASIPGLADEAARRAFLQDVGRGWGLIVDEAACEGVDTVGDVVTWITDAASDPIVFMCWSPMCATSRGYEQRLQGIIAEGGARFYPLCSASLTKERNEDIAPYLEEHKLPYHVLLDRSQVACDIFGGRVTPHIFVLDAQNRLRYSGSIDNDPSNEVQDVWARQNWLADALAALADDLPVYVMQTDAKG